MKNTPFEDEICNEDCTIKVRFVVNQLFSSTGVCRVEFYDIKIGARWSEIEDYFVLVARQCGQQYAGYVEVNP